MDSIFSSIAPPPPIINKITKRKDRNNRTRNRSINNDTIAQGVVA